MCLEIDRKFMSQALLEAEKALLENEIPIGAVLVCNGEIISRGKNAVECCRDASCHAEMLCLQRGAKKLGNWRLLNATLYCTLEPCIMCAGAMILFRIKRLVYGAPDLRHGGDGSIVDCLDGSHPIHNIDVTSGICEGEAKAKMQEFFRNRRKQFVAIGINT